MTSDPAKPLVVRTEALDPQAAQWLAERATLVECPFSDTDRLRQLLPNAHALLVRTYTRVDAHLLDLAPNLRVVARAGVGLENIDIPACTARNVRVVSTPDANSSAVAELVFAVLLDAVRPRLFLDAPVPPDRWASLRAELIGQRQLEDLTLGVLGLGRVGSRVARIGSAFGMRVLRRPLEADELAALVSLYEAERAASDADSALELAVQALFMSPAFLYHVEIGTQGDTQALLLTGYETASRLSYFLWGTMPDDALFAAAADGSLETREGIEAEARRMLEDPKAREMMREFQRQWLDLRRIDDFARDAETFPEWDPALLVSMQKETETFFEQVIFEGDGRLETLLSAPYSYLDPALAEPVGDQRGRATGRRRDRDAPALGPASPHDELRRLDQALERVEADDADVIEEGLERASAADHGARMGLRERAPEVRPAENVGENGLAGGLRAPRHRLETGRIAERLQKQEDHARLRIIDEEIGDLAD